MKIIIPELQSPTIKEAVRQFDDIEFVSADTLEQAAKMLADKKADSLISGLDYSSRDVVLATKAHIPLSSKFFSSCFICERSDCHFVIADGGVNKQPTEEQLYCIVEDSAITYKTYYNEQPKIAMLSYSTYGSGGKNPDLEKIHNVITKIHANHPDWLIDGEMQLDAATNPRVAAKKTPESPLMGQANVLITPDLNSGNILYKSLERFGGFTIAGPILQGFSVPLADLSRGSTTEDVSLTIKVILKQLERKSS
jgi:phosphotransacetylase